MANQTIENLQAESTALQLQQSSLTSNAKEKISKAIDQLSLIILSKGKSKRMFINLYGQMFYNYI